MKRTYSEMKDSGVEWIGEIPKEWQTNKFKRFLYRNETKNKGDKEVLSLYRELGIVPKNSRADNHNVTSEDTSKYKYVRIGDFVVNKMKAWQGSVAISNYEGIVSPAYYVYSFKNNTYKKRYFHFLLRSCYKDEFRRLSGGIRIGQWDLPAEALEDIFVIVPSLSEQTAISDYLDEKCAEIDSIISEAKNCIEEYKQWKSAIIFEAVTKGLDPNAEMKDSDVEWIGEIPKEWKIIKIKNIAFLKGRIGWQGLESKEYQEEGAFLITGTDFDSGTINWDNCVHISEQRYYEDKLLHIKENDLLITKDGTIGKLAIVKNCPKQVTLNSGVMYIRGNSAYKYLTKYLYYVLISEEFWEWYNASQRGNSTIKHLYQEQFYNFIFAFPSLSEQNVIANYLDEKCARIDEVISEKGALISELELYKKSLIYEVVTGKVKVS